MLFSKAIFLSVFVATAQLVSAQLASRTNESVYFLKNQKFLDFGSVFQLIDGNTPNVQNFQLAEAFSCAVQELENLNYFNGSIISIHVRDAPEDNTDMVDIAHEFALLNVVAPVVSVDQEKLDQFFDTAKGYDSPVVAYMPSGTLQLEVPTSKDLLFAAPVDSYQSKPLISLARGLKFKRFGAIASSTLGMQNLLKAFKEDGNNYQSVEDRIQVICEINDQGKEEQFTNFVECMSRNQINRIALFVTQTDIFQIIQRLKENGILKPDTMIFGSHTWTNQATFDTLINQEGIDYRAFLNTVSAIPSIGNSNLLRACLAKRTARIQPYTEYRRLYETAMKCKVNATLTPCEPQRASLANPTGTCSCRDDETLASITIDNPGVNYVIDAVFVSGHAYYEAIFNCPEVAAAINANENILCGENGNITGSQIAEIARHFPFIGYTGKVLYMDNYRRYNDFDYYQFNGTKFVKAGYWSIPENLEEIYDTSSIAQSFASGKASVIDKGPVITPTKWDSPEGIAIAIITSLGLFCTLVTTIFVIIYRDNPVIKRASPLFCAMMLAGISILYFQLFVWIGPQNSGSCVSKIWLPIFGFGMLMGPMLAKTFRIWKIFDNSKLRARRLLTGHLMGMSAAVIGVNLALLIIWTAIDPLKPIQLEDGFYLCGTYNNNLQTGFIIVFAIYNGLLLVLGSILSYKTRSVVSSFNESTTIAYTMYNFLLCMVVLLPIYYIVAAGENKNFPRAGTNRNHLLSFVIRSGAFLFANTACLVILFGPKIYHVIKKTEDKSDMPTSHGADNSGKKSFGSSKAGTSARTGAKNSTLVGGGVYSAGQINTYDGSRPGATIGERYSQITSTATTEAVIKTTANLKYTGTVSEAPTEITSGVFNAGATVIENVEEVMVSSVIEN